MIYFHYFNDMAQVKYLKICLVDINLKIIIQKAVRVVSEMQPGISIKAECTIFRNNLQINCKKKSKLSVVTLDEKAMILIITGKGDNQEFKFPLQKLKTILKKFIDEGRITIQFDSNGDSTIYKGLEKANENVQSEGSFQIFISNACKQNLHFLITKMISLKKKLQQSNESCAKSKQRAQQKQTMQKNRKRPAQQIKEQQINKPKLSRKQLFQLAKNEHNQKPAREKKLDLPQLAQTKKIKITLMSLPKMLIRQILSYSGIHLSQRLISKQISEIVLKNIAYIKFKDDVDDEAFNKLGKWAIRVEGRLKCVKNLKLLDRYDDQVLTKNKAKTLKFANWKQISAKNITNLKGLRIYCLEIPYQIKFELSHLFGLRLVELRLKGKGINIKSSMVKDEDMLHIINNINDLRVFETAYASTKLISQIKKPEKMQELKIGTLNRIPGFQNWTNIKRFTNLRIFSVENTQKLGNSQDQQSVVQELQFPEQLTTLQIGFNLSVQSRSLIPTQIRKLKLLGTHFRNRDLREFFLPCLQSLDIIECPNLTAQCLQNMLNLHVITNWNRNQVEYANKFLQTSNIRIQTVRGFSYC